MFGIKKRIYLDYAAATPIKRSILLKMLPYFLEKFANPLSLYKEGVETAKVLKESRKKVARNLLCKESEIIFTGGGTESNNMAILGVFKNALKSGIKNPHFITTNIEHSSVSEVFSEIKRRGGEVSFIPVSQKGIVNPQEIIENLKDNTVLISVHYANNEIGVIQPISKISRMLEKACSKAIFHTDASQAPLYLPIEVQKLGVDLMTLDGSKIYGPKGIGCLFVKRKTKISPIIFGGGQERNLRAGTHNIPLIIGFSEALNLACKNREKESARLLDLREYFLEELFKIFPNGKLQGDREERLPNNINFSIPGIDSEFAVIKLDNKGIACSGGSACNSLSGVGSGVVKALGFDKDGNSSLRFSLGEKTRKTDIKKAIKALKEAKLS